MPRNSIDHPPSLQQSPESTERRKFLNQIITSCLKNMNKKKEQDLSDKIEQWTEKIDEETFNQVKVIDIYSDLVRQSNKNRFQDLQVIEETETLNAQNDYENFLNKEAVYEAKMSNKAKILTLIKNNKQTVWKPMKLRLNKVVRDEIDKLMSNTAQ